MLFLFNCSYEPKNVLLDFYHKEISGLYLGVKIYLLEFYFYSTYLFVFKFNPVELFYFSCKIDCVFISSFEIFAKF